MNNQLLEKIKFSNFKDYLNIDIDSKISIIFPSNNILRKEYINDIDSSDFVIRFNDFIIDGYEKNVGTKTNLVLANSKTIGSGVLNNVNCLKIAATPLYNKDNYIFDHYTPIDYENVISIIKEELGLKLDDKLPTAGIVVILLLIYNGFKNIYLFGYESKLTTEKYTYYYKKDRGDADKDAHNMKMESELIEKLSKENKITII